MQSLFENAYGDGDDDGDGDGDDAGRSQAAGLAR